MPGNISVTRYPIPQTAGTLGSLSAIQTLSQLIFSKPDAAILFIGFSALREGKLPTETCLQNLFFIQTCLANSIIPITVAPPPTPDIPHQNSRLFALYSKEIALAYGIPDIDLFSMQRIQNIDTNNWFFSNGTSISTPNDSSRTWMAKQTAKSIKQFFHQLNHNN